MPKPPLPGGGLYLPSAPNGCNGRHHPTPAQGASGGATTETPGFRVQTPSREHLCTTIQALEDDTLLTHPPPLPLHVRRALLSASDNWNWTENMAGGASLHSTDALQHAPCTPTMVMTLCQAVTSTGVLHTLHRGRSPHSNSSPLFVLHDAGPLICSQGPYTPKTRHQEETQTRQARPVSLTRASGNNFAQKAHPELS
jgi:hypothetical protein